jgi:hypothetical protein
MNELFVFLSDFHALVRESFGKSFHEAQKTAMYGTEKLYKE